MVWFEESRTYATKRSASHMMRTVLSLELAVLALRDLAGTGSTRYVFVLVVFAKRGYAVTTTTFLMECGKEDGQTRHRVQQR